MLRMPAYNRISRCRNAQDDAPGFVRPPLGEGFEPGDR